jgi:WD40 repeat protein/tetratricopeptide (TPR) repeat protein
VSVAIFSPDAKRIATTSGDQTARIWDAVTGLPVTPAIKLKDLTFSAEFSPDGARVAADVGGSAEIWDATTGQPALPTLEQTGVRAVHFSPDGKLILTASFDMTARLWDAATGHANGPSLQTDEALLCGSFSRDGERIVTGSKQGTGQIWSTKTRRRISETFQHRDEITSANFSADGTRVLTASKDGTAQLWDATRRGLAPLVLPAAKPPDWIASAWFDQDSKRVHTRTHDGVAQVWDALAGTLLSTEPEKTPRPASITADGKRRAVISKDMITVTVFDSVTDKPVASPVVHPAQSFVISTALSEDGNRLLTAAIDNCVRLWDVKTGKLVFDPIKHPQFVRSLSFSKDGSRILTGCMDRAARVWDANTGRALLEPLRHGEGGLVEDAQFSADGKRIVTASTDGKAQIWDANTGQRLTEPFLHDEPFVHVARFSPDGRWLVTTVAGNAYVWDTAPLPEKTPDWLPQLAEAVGGWHLNEKNLLVPVEDQWDALNQIRARLSANANDPFERWGSWILANGENRSVSPFSTVRISTPPAVSPVAGSSSPAPPISAPAQTEPAEHMLMMACLQHGIFSLGSLHEPAFAVESYERALNLAKKLAAAQPTDSAARTELVVVSTFLSEGYIAAKQPDKALIASLDALKWSEKEAQAKSSDTQAQKKLADAWANLAYAQLCNRQPREAIDSARKGLEKDPTSSWLKANLATAYLFNGEYSQAEPIYREIKDAEIAATPLQSWSVHALAAQKKNYADVVAHAFGELKGLGVEHPDTEKARELLGRAEAPDKK